LTLNKKMNRMANLFNSCSLNSGKSA